MNEKFYIHVSLVFRYHDRLGVAIGNTSVLIKALPMNGRTYVTFYILVCSSNYINFEIIKDMYKTMSTIYLIHFFFKF